MALYAAGQSGCISMCRMLLAVGSDVEKREPYTQFTPLHFAALNEKSADMFAIMEKYSTNPELLKHHNLQLQVTVFMSFPR